MKNIVVILESQFKPVLSGSPINALTGSVKKQLVVDEVYQIEILNRVLHSLGLKKDYIVVCNSTTKNIPEVILHKDVKLLKGFRHLRHVLRERGVDGRVASEVVTSRYLSGQSTEVVE